MTEVTEKFTLDEFSETLTGFDEIAIEKAFKVDSWSDLPPLKMLRALKFVMLRRDGLADPDALEAVRNMALGEVNDTFADEMTDEQIDQLAELRDAKSLRPSQVKKLAALEELEAKTIRAEVGSGKDDAPPE